MSYVSQTLRVQYKKKTILFSAELLPLIPIFQFSLSCKNTIVQVRERLQGGHRLFNCGHGHGSQELARSWQGALGN
jgi:hypothetical protein